MGYAWLLGAIVFWRKASALQLTAWIALGIGVLWKDVVKPFWKRRHIRASVAASQEVAFEFTDNAIRIEALGVGTFNRAWDELDGTINSDEGVLIYFNDGTVNWLPRRVFPNDVTKRAFHYHLLQRLPDAQTEDDSLQQD